MSEHSPTQEEQQLGEFCELITKGTTPQAYSTKGINFIKVESISSDGQLIASKFAKISEGENANLKRSQLRSGDILFSIAGTLGRVAAVEERHLPANTNQALAIARLKNDALDRQYCLQCLTSEKVQLHLKKLQTIGAQPNLSLQQVSQIPILVPPLPEQKKIAEILSGIDQLIKCTKEKNAKLKVARDALIQNLREEDTQEWVSLSEISDFVTSGSRGWSQFYSDKGARFVRIGNLSRHSIDLDPEPQRWQLVEPPKGAEGERTRLQEQDILISITADLGICCIYSSSLGEAYINQHIALVRIDAEHRSYARQVAYYICSEHCQEQIRSMNDSGAKAGLNLDSIRKVQVPLIEGGKGNKFVQSIDSLQDAIVRNACQLQQLAKAKNALSSDLLSGRKRVSV